MLAYLGLVPKQDKSESPRPRQRFTTLLPSEHLRRTAVQAGQEMDREQTDSVVSIARVLGEIDDVGSRTDLHARLEQLEGEVARLKGRREEGDQSIESQLSVLRTTLESALGAIASLSLPAPGFAPEVVDMLRTELDEKIVAARSDLRYEIVNLENKLTELPEPGGEEARMEALREDFQARMEALREDFQARMDAADERAEKAAAYLEEMVGALRTELDEQKGRQAEVLGRLSTELSGLATSMAPPKAGVTETAG